MATDVFNAAFCLLLSALCLPKGLRRRAFGERDLCRMRSLISPAVGCRPPVLRHVKAEVHHALRNVHAGWRDAVAELHGVVDFVDENAAIRILEQVERHHPTTARARGSSA